MPQWAPSPGWPTRNSSTRTCCSSDRFPVISSRREYFLTNPRPSHDNSACGRSRRESQRPGAKLRCDVLVMPEHVLRVVAALQRDEAGVLFGPVERDEAVGGFVGHEIHIAAGRERLHRLPGLADPGDVTLGIGVVHVPGPDNIQVVLRFAVWESRGVL